HRRTHTQKRRGSRCEALVLFPAPLLFVFSELRPLAQGPIFVPFPGRGCPTPVSGKWPGKTVVKKSGKRDEFTAWPLQGENPARSRRHGCRGVERRCSDPCLCRCGRSEYPLSPGRGTLLDPVVKCLDAGAGSPSRADAVPHGAGGPLRILRSVG